MSEEKAADTEKKDGVFIASLKRNSSKIRADRAQAIGEDAELIYKRKIEDLEVSIKKMERDQENMMDLSPSETTSLKVASDFDAEAYADKDFELCRKIRDAKVLLDIVKARYKKLFIGE